MQYPRTSLHFEAYQRANNKRHQLHDSSSEPHNPMEKRKSIVCHIRGVPHEFFQLKDDLVQIHQEMQHDIGKMVDPIFFTENQIGSVNPHKNLSYEQSAQIIISHITEGLKMAEKNNLPKVIKDFISTHHGRGKTKYFYIS